MWNIEDGAFLSDECRLQLLLEKGDYEKVRRELKARKELFSGREAAQLLSAAVVCPPEVFRFCLDACEPDMVIGHCEMPLPGEMRLEISGVMLTIAAALGKEEHIAMLLEMGSEVNGQLKELTQGKMCRERLTYPPKNISCYRLDRREDQRILDDVWTIPSSPLAAAILCAKPGAAELLIKAGAEVWQRREVSIAVAMALCGSAAQKATVERLFPGITQGAAYPIRPEELGRYGSVEVIRQQLESGAYTRQEPAPQQRGTRLSDNGRERKLLMLEAEYADRFTKELLAAHLLRSALETHASPRLREAWLRQVGETADLSPLGEWLEHCDREKLREALEEARRRKVRLTMDMDAVRPSTEGCRLRMLLRCVEFQCLRSDPESISGFTAAVLATGSLRLLQDVQKRGLLRWESPVTLLEYTKWNRDAQALRPMILAGEYEDHGLHLPIPAYEIDRYNPFWRGIGPRGAIERLVEKKATKEECISCLLNYMSMDNAFFRYPGRGDIYRGIFAGVFEQMCMRTMLQGGNPAILDAMYTLDPGLREGILSMDLIKDDVMVADLRGTLRAFAVLYGDETMRAALGVADDSVGMQEMFTTERFYGKDKVPAVLAAILIGAEESAKRLLAAGAPCDPDDPAIRRMLQESPERVRRLAAELLGSEMEESIYE